jgi:hypothetical protein
MNALSDQGCSFAQKEYQGRSPWLVSLIRREAGGTTAKRLSQRGRGLIPKRESVHLAVPPGDYQGRERPDAASVCRDQSLGDFVFHSDSHPV